MDLLKIIKDYVTKKPLQSLAAASLLLGACEAGSIYKSASSKGIPTFSTEHFTQSYFEPGNPLPGMSTQDYLGLDKLHHHRHALYFGGFALLAGLAGAARNRMMQKITAESEAPPLLTAKNPRRISPLMPVVAAGLVMGGEAARNIATYHQNTVSHWGYTIPQAYGLSTIHSALRDSTPPWLTGVYGGPISNLGIPAEPLREAKNCKEEILGSLRTNNLDATQREGLTNDLQRVEADIREKEELYLQTHIPAEIAGRSMRLGYLENGVTNGLGLLALGAGTLASSYFERRRKREQKTSL